MPTKTPQNERQREKRIKERETEYPRNVEQLQKESYMHDGNTRRKSKRERNRMFEVIWLRIFQN